jgi:uncharacterized protein
MRPEADLDLRSRLARLDPSAGAQVTKPVQRTQAELSAAMEALGLQCREGGAGPVWTREFQSNQKPPTEQPSELAALMTGQAPGDLAWDEVLFLDTETTGLAGGTGTLAFLVGLGWWENDRFHGRLDFLPGPGAEPALLHSLVDLASRFRVVITYNGNCFDLPLLRTRGILNRRRDILTELVSWDLLPAARRLWGRRLPNVRQPTVEQFIADIPRDDTDIPGAQIPKAWTDFVQHGECGFLDRVLDHNQWDVEGMAAILSRVAAGAARLNAGPHSLSTKIPWQDAWSLARLCESQRRTEESWQWAQHSLSAAPTGKIQRRQKLGPPEKYFADTIRLLKRSKDWSAVEDVIQTALLHGPNLPWLHREAAILYEHRMPDIPRALGHARNAADEHRFNRLQRKLSQIEVSPCNM